MDRWAGGEGVRRTRCHAVSGCGREAAGARRTWVARVVVGGPWVVVEAGEARVAVGPQGGGAAGEP